MISDYVFRVINQETGVMEIKLGSDAYYVKIGPCRKEDQRRLLRTVTAHMFPTRVFFGLVVETSLGGMKNNPRPRVVYGVSALPRPMTPFDMKAGSKSRT